MRPVIGITSGTAVDKNFPNSPRIMGQQFTYVDAIVRAGGTPLFLPIVNNKDALKQLYKMCDGLLFGGGNDITPARYGAVESPHTTEMNAERDDQELQLWQWADADETPVLGICRGLQIINVGCGGTLYQDIPTEIPGAEKHLDHKKGDYTVIYHQLRIEPGSQLAQILGTTTIAANAHHHQAVKEVGEGLQVTARAQDNVVEGLEAPGKRFVVAVQSHPEALEAEIKPEWRQLFTAFVDAARLSLLLPEQQQARSSSTR